MRPDEVIEAKERLSRWSGLRESKSTTEEVQDRAFKLRPDPNIATGVPEFGTDTVDSRKLLKTIVEGETDAGLPLWQQRLFCREIIVPLHGDVEYSKLHMLSPLDRYAEIVI